MILAHHSFIADMNLILTSSIQKKCRKKNKFDDHCGMRLGHMEMTFDDNCVMRLGHMETIFNDNCGMRLGHMETMFQSPSVFIVLLSTRNPEFRILNLLGIKTVLPIWICSNARPHA